MTATLAALNAALAGRYTIERELGAGGMATVFRAHDLKHDRDVAIKVLHQDLGAALGSERFLSEIRTTARLQHPHILPLLDSGDADGLLYYVMPLVAGETLRGRLTRERQLPIADAVLIAREVADALEYAHGLGVIHRDIKPENILLQNGHALVADFGIALAVQTAGSARMTQTGLSLGTPQYMSPEQAMGERGIDARSDIYALGAVTYEMLAGDPPFTGSSAQAVVALILTTAPRPIRTFRPNVPPSLERAVMTAIEKLPADRQVSAAEFAGALVRGASASSADARPETAAPSLVAPKSAVRIRFVALGALLVAASVWAGWGAARSFEQSTSAPEPLTVTSILAPRGGDFAERRSLALTPDGRRLAFVFASSNGTRSLWLRHLDRLDAEPIPKTTGADAPFWSRDGRTLGFFADGHLTVLDANGNTRQLCPVVDPAGATWGTDDVILFSHRDGIATVSASGGACRLVVARQSGQLMTAEFLPDGKHFVYSRGNGFDLQVARLDGSTVATLPVRTAQFTIAAPNVLVMQSKDDIRALDAQRFDVRTFALQGPRIRLVSDLRSAGGIISVTFSSSGAVAYLPGTIDAPYIELDANGLIHDTVRVDGTWTLAVRPPRAGPPLVAVAGVLSGLFLYDLDADRATKLFVRDSGGGLEKRFPGGAFPTFSPDGSRLIYAVNSATRCAMAERNLRTDVERIVMRDTMTAGSVSCPVPTDWSSDGKSILVRRDTTLLIMTSDGWRVTQEIARPGRIRDAAFAPDARTIAYSSDETGRAEVYVQALPTGVPMRVSSVGGRWPVWTPDGRRLWFVTPDGRAQDVTIAGAQGSAVPTPRTRFTIPNWGRSTFDTRTTGFAMFGDGQRFFVRMSPAGVAVAYAEHWLTLLPHADSARRASAPR